MRDYSRWYMDPVEEQKFVEELDMKQEKLCESEDMTMEELGAENSRVDEVRERISMMALSREAVMQTDPTKVIFPPNITPENRVKALETMRLAMEAERSRQPQTTGYVSTQNIPPAAKANDVQIGGDHYKKLTIQPWDVVDQGPKEQAIGFYRYNALKYIMRAGTKGDFKEDVQKALHYLQKLSEILE